MRSMVLENISAHLQNNHLKSYNSLFVKHTKYLHMHTYISTKHTNTLYAKYMQHVLQINRLVQGDPMNQTIGLSINPTNTSKKSHIILINQAITIQ